VPAPLRPPAKAAGTLGLPDAWIETDPGRVETPGTVQLRCSKQPRWMSMGAKLVKGGQSTKTTGTVSCWRGRTTPVTPPCPTRRLNANELVRRFPSLACRRRCGWPYARAALPLTIDVDSLAGLFVTDGRTEHLTELLLRSSCKRPTTGDGSIGDAGFRLP